MLLKLIRSAFNREQPLGDVDRLAVEHYERGELAQAEPYLREIAVRNPTASRAWTNLAVALLRQQKFADALPVLNHVVELEPDLAEAHFDLGNCYNRLRRNTDAIAEYRRAIELKPDLHKAHAQLVNAYMDCCDWDAVDRWIEHFNRYRAKEVRSKWAERVEPFCALTLFPGELHKEIATYRAKQMLRSIQPSKAPARARGDRIRVGYVSADFYDHATAHLTYGMYAAHDRAGFEVHAYSTGPDDGSVYRRHIMETCDAFTDVRQESPVRTAERIRDDGIDILIDMKGYTADGRMEIFAHRPAPLQVSFLAYPGTSGAPFIDYFISDPVATPKGYEREFTERIVRLPDSYQVNDNRQEISAKPVRRNEHGLPETGFVYCGFNQLRKIDRAIFAAWMRILARVPGSVLWLLQGDPQAEANLRVAAQAAGIDPGRLVFAGKADKPAHLARHRLADLFLDTPIYNAHTGASDALWAGLPVLTCPGKTFATRVAASLLTAAGLPELIAKNLEEYEAMAVRLAEAPDQLAELRRKLESERMTCALFDTKRFVKNLEAGYRQMHERAQRGAPPQSFDV